MSRDPASYRSGQRWAVTWLHKHARTMNDPWATALLNVCASDMGIDAARGNTVLRDFYASYRKPQNWPVTLPDTRPEFHGQQKETENDC